MFDSPAASSASAALSSPAAIAPSPRLQPWSSSNGRSGVRRAKKPAGSKRNVLEESARIARGEIVDLAQVKGADYDAIVLPGGWCPFRLSSVSFFPSSKK